MKYLAIFPVLFLSLVVLFAAGPAQAGCQVRDSTCFQGRMEGYGFLPPGASTKKPKVMKLKTIRITEDGEFLVRAPTGTTAVTHKAACYDNSDTYESAVFGGWGRDAQLKTGGKGSDFSSARSGLCFAENYGRQDMMDNGSTYQPIPDSGVAFYKVRHVGRNGQSEVTFLGTATN